MYIEKKGIEYMWNELYVKTPKDTGAARSSWNISVNNPDYTFNKDKHSNTLNIPSFKINDSLIKLDTEQKADAATIAHLTFDAINALVGVDSDPSNDEIDNFLDSKDFENALISLYINGLAIGFMGHLPPW